MKQGKRELMFVVPTVIAVLFSTFPIYWMVSCSVRTYVDLTTVPPHLFPQALSGEFYRRVLLHTPFLTFLKNSLIISLGTVAINAVVGSMAAHSLARLKFRGKFLLSRGILIAYVFPKIVMIVPIFVTIVRLGLYNTHLGLILTNVVFTFPFCVWMLTAYFETVPVVLEESARIDGASNLRTFTQITFPLAAPGVAAASIFAFISCWREFLYALLILNAEGKKTLTVGMYGFLGAEVFEWGEMLAMNSLMMIPVVVFFLILQRSFIQGLTAGAVKG